MLSFLTPDVGGYNVVEETGVVWGNRPPGHVTTILLNDNVFWTQAKPVANEGFTNGLSQL